MDFFKPVGHDSCGLSATLDLGSGYNLTNKVVALKIGGATNVTFTLDRKGRGNGIGEHGVCKLSYNRRTRLYVLEALMVRGSWQAAWSNYGMISSNVPFPGILITNFQVTVTLDTTNYTGLVPALHYTAGAGKLGVAEWLQRRAF